MGGSSHGFSNKVNFLHFSDNVNFLRLSSTIEEAEGYLFDHVVAMEGINMLLDPSFCSTKNVPREELL